MVTTIEKLLGVRGEQLSNDLFEAHEFVSLDRHPTMIFEENISTVPFPFPRTAYGDMNIFSCIFFAAWFPIGFVFGLIRYLLMFAYLFFCCPSNSVMSYYDMVILLSGLVRANVKYHEQYEQLILSKKEMKKRVQNQTSSNPILYLTNHSNDLDIPWCAGILTRHSGRKVRFVTRDGIIPAAMTRFMSDVEWRDVIAMTATNTMKKIIEEFIKDGSYDIILAPSSMTAHRLLVAAPYEHTRRLCGGRANVVPVMHVSWNVFGAHTRLFEHTIFKSLFLDYTMPFWIVDISVGCPLSTSSSEEPLHDAMMATAEMGELAPLLSTKDLIRSNWSALHKKRMTKYANNKRTYALGYPNLAHLIDEEDDNSMNSIRDEEGKSRHRVYIRFEGVLGSTDFFKLLFGLWLSNKFQLINFVSNCFSFLNDYYLNKLEWNVCLVRSYERLSPTNIQSLLVGNIDWLKQMYRQGYDIIYVVDGKLGDKLDLYKSIIEEKLREDDEIYGENCQNKTFTNIHVIKSTELQPLAISQSDFIITSRLDEITAHSWNGILVNPASIEDEMMAAALKIQIAKAPFSTFCNQNTGSEGSYLEMVDIALLNKFQQLPLRRSYFSHVVSNILHLVLMEKLFALLLITIVGTQIYSEFMIDLTQIAVLTYLVQSVLKNLLMRPRPSWLGVCTFVPKDSSLQPDYSFPSGHTSFAVTIVITTSYYNYRTMTIVFIVLCVLTALNRIYRGVHFCRYVN
jgi:hypothetical protein